MRAISLLKPERFEQVTIADPGSPGPGQVLVKTHRMGICGTDVGGYLGKFPFFGYPRIIGHELGVEVLELGPDVDSVSVGDSCSIEPYLNCGHCYACRRGFTNCCETNQTLGVMCDGGLCERFLIRADKLHVSKSLTYEQLALVETLAIGCHAVDRGAPAEGDHVMVIGAGPIGLSAIEFARLTGARLTVMDQVASRLDFCEKTYGIENRIQFENPEQAKQAIMEITDGDRFALVIDATGNPHSMTGAMHYVAQTGTLVYVGITNQELCFPHAVMHKPEMTIKASRNAMPTDFARIIRLIEEGTINTDPWITHRVSWDDMIEAFPTYTRPDAGVLKAVVDVSGE
ncbi:Putative L-galactonate oxidoreductase [Roseimaritima multifibrata]|uniref:L-galactonate oxidoreductase n=1 Tax=Roseimaritima multifibrata TaxID=1930274 RepID=A0A517MF15_9BACT|nr:zinc-binding alcohol dehydrogenase family protein [Roseimaritima multifibrata]QDS93480.1 Putative L-galactonate oxidoreductase [Roseimaritima multifibrata]